MQAGFICISPPSIFFNICSYLQNKKRNGFRRSSIDGIKIGEYEKTIPLNDLFNALPFDANGNSAENDKYFIRIRKITNEQ
jgi:hypothetical protein